ncbi:MAG: hypothetical protein WCL02_02005 [bacterium]
MAGLLSIQEELSISEELDAIFRDANAVAKTMGDRTVSVYYIFLSLLKSKNAISKLLNNQ